MCVSNPLLILILSSLTYGRVDFRNKFGVIHQSFTPNKERELYSAELSICATEWELTLRSPFYRSDRHPEDSYDYLRRSVL